MCSRAARRAAVMLYQRGVFQGVSVDVEAMLHREGVAVHRWPFDESISGVFLRRRKPVIAVNTNHHSTRQRFTMAHEYYHYLHHRSFSQIVCIMDLQDTRAHEREANYFAACLLMPEGAVLNLLRRYDLETVAKKMMVSMEALQWRLRELGVSERRIA